MKKAPSTKSVSSAGVRRFEFNDGKSHKFWEASIGGSEVTVHFGRIGTPGQSQTKSFPDEAAAVKHLEKLVREKTAKGYREIV